MVSFAAPTQASNKLQHEKNDIASGLSGGPTRYVNVLCPRDDLDPEKSGRQPPRLPSAK
jgi:hypothetical protein